MSEDKHLFRLQSVLEGNSQSTGTIEVEGSGALAFGIPPQFGGQAGRPSPEGLLLSAVTSCYSLTLAILAERRRLPVTRIEVQAEGEVVTQPGGTLKYTAIHLHPKITLDSDDEAQHKSTLDFAHKAEVYCVISSAIRGNVEITVEPEIVRA